MHDQPSNAAPDDQHHGDDGLDGEAAAGLDLPSSIKDDSKSADEQKPGFVPMSEGQAKREAGELQEYMEKMLCRFGTDIKSAMDAHSRQLESLENRVTALTSSLADTRAAVNASTIAAAHQSAVVGEALRDVLSGLQLVRDRQELSNSHLELAKASVASVRLLLTPAACNAPMPAHMSSVAMATPEANTAQAPQPQHGMLELPTAPLSVAVRASPSASAPPAPPPAPHVALVQPGQALSANSTQFVPSNQQQLPQAQSKPAIQPQPQQMQQLPDYLQRQVPGESPIAQPAGAAPGNLSRHQQPQQQQQQQQQPQQQAFVPAQPQSQQQQIPAYQLQQPAYAPSPRSSNGSFVPPPQPFAVQARPSSPPQAQYGVPPQHQQQQHHTVSSAAPPYAPPASYAPHPHMQQQMYQQRQQQWLAFKGSQPQFAAQPPLPPRMVQQAPPPGLWQGPQPEPVRSPSQQPDLDASHAAEKFKKESSGKIHVKRSPALTCEETLWFIGGAKQTLLELRGDTQRKVASNGKKFRQDFPRALKKVAERHGFDADQAFPRHGRGLTDLLARLKEEYRLWAGMEEQSGAGKWLDVDDEEKHAMLDRAGKPSPKHTPAGKAKAPRSLLGNDERVFDAMHAVFKKNPFVQHAKTNRTGLQDDDRNEEDGDEARATSHDPAESNMHLEDTDPDGTPMEDSAPSPSRKRGRWQPPTSSCASREGRTSDGCGSENGPPDTDDAARLAAEPVTQARKQDETSLQRPGQGGLAEMA